MRYLYYIVVNVHLLLASNFANAFVVDDQVMVVDTAINVSIDNDEFLRLETLLPISFLKPDISYIVTLSSNSQVFCFSNGALYKVLMPTESYVTEIEKVIENNFAVISNKEGTILDFKIYHTKTSLSQAIKQQIIDRSKTGHFNNGFIIISILTALMLAIVRVNYPNRFNEVFNLNRIFSLRPKEGDTNRLRVFDISGIVTGAVYLFICSAIITFFTHSNNISLLPIENDNVFLSLITNILVISFLLVLKVILVYVVSSIYQLKRINAFYIKELININLIFISAVLFASVGTFFYWGYFPQFYFTFLKVILPVLYLLRLLLIYFKILKLSGFTNVYLFSYFCTTEIFPLVIGLKYFY